MPEITALSDMFRPPVNHAMRVLDRAFFRKSVPLAAARVIDDAQISRCRTYLSKDVLHVDRISCVRSIPGEQSAGQKACKALLLSPNIRPDDPSTWSSKLLELIEAKKVNITPYELKLSYDTWTYHDILSAIIPEDAQNELPAGFSIVGHVAHLNLREQYLQYKNLIAAVLLDKNPVIRSVINKIDDVGTENEYRTFKYELLAGDPSLQVEIKELDCTFRFDYSKVYWNSRLNTEHERLVDHFRPGEAVCDVMAGVGPFAVPAAKRGIFVWANDLNPDSYASLIDAISVNKVSQFLQPFNEDGSSFIRTSAQKLLADHRQVDITPKIKRRSRKTESSQSTPSEPRMHVTQPKTFHHYVMNLPATAITFLGAFIGLYKGHQELFSPHTNTLLPMIHVYCFSTKSDDNKAEAVKICKEISSRIGFDIHPHDEEVEIWDVRDVAPQKRMFCASFRLPPEVAFR
ncbi:tRNA(m(1)G37)methyltransferase [Xylographa opegraphella]|nr:tRNA(m(1)G37)methyltransferase [Xylographa opegraphella]